MLKLQMHSKLHCYLYNWISKPATADIILGFAPVFLLIKSYASCSITELSQLCYFGVYRTIALGSTDALCTWRCLSLVALQPVIVPVGRIALGRIFNVLGCIIDGYIAQNNSCQFNKSIFVAQEPFIESNLLDLTYAVNYPNHVLTFHQEDLSLNQLLPIRIIINTMNYASTLYVPNRMQWIFYIAYFYLNVLLNKRFIKNSCTYNSLSAMTIVTYSSISLTLTKYFYSTDTLFAQIKPIHLTPVGIYLLTINRRLFETGIKVLDLLTPYKKGGKIELFGGAGKQ